MSDVNYLHRLLQNAPRLAASVVAFNWHPAAYLHPVRRQQWLPEIPDAVWRESRVSGRLSGLLLARAGLHEKNFIVTPFTLWPLALLPADRLHRLALHIGAMLLGVRVRTSLSREHVIAWKRKLGAEAYRFAMHSASMLPAVKLPLHLAANHSADELGMGVIMAALKNAPEALSQRISLKMPADTDAVAMESDKAAQLSMMIARIVEGEWFSSLAALRT